MISAFSSLCIFFFPPLHYYRSTAQESSMWLICCQRKREHSRIKTATGFSTVNGPPSLVTGGSIYSENMTALCIRAMWVSDSSWDLKCYFHEKPCRQLACNLNYLLSPPKADFLHLWVFPCDDLLCITFHFTHNVNFTANYPNASYYPKLSLLKAVSCLVRMPKRFLKHSGFY